VALLARAVVVVAAIAAVVVFAQRRSDAAACEHARTALFSAGLKGAAPAATVQKLTDACRDPEQIAIAAAGVTAGGHPDVGAALARTAVRRGPEEFASWAALAGALRRTDPAAADRAARRARELNPRWSAPAAVPAQRTSASPQG
jgi:hypothetical protein